MDEFSLISTFFNKTELNAAGGLVDVGIGDDGAVISTPAHSQLVQSIDTLVADTHFPAMADAGLVAFRSLAVSVSDLAAMGANPHSFFLALTLPHPNETWLKSFGDGLARAARQFHITLAGGDTTRGPLSVTLHVQGFLEHGRALLRSGASPGDLVYVSGTLGDASAALPYVLASKPVHSAAEQFLLDRFWQPCARIALGQWLRCHGATAAIDVSDGLVADLGHLAKASRCGVHLARESLPLSGPLKTIHGDRAAQYAMTGGDDYELCFTWPPAKPLPNTIPCTVHCIGRLSDKADSFVVDGKPIDSTGVSGYRHFGN